MRACEKSVRCASCQRGRTDFGPECMTVSANSRWDRPRRYVGEDDMVVEELRTTFEMHLMPRPTTSQIFVTPIHHNSFHEYYPHN